MKKQMMKTNNPIIRTNRTKTKYGGSCIQSNRFVSLIKDIVASIIILLAITFNDGDPYRSSAHKDLNHDEKCLNQEFLRVGQGDRNALCHTMGSAGGNVHYLLLLFHKCRQGLNNQNYV